jgi:hypothetical protein
MALDAELVSRKMLAERFARDSPLEESGFEPLVPLTPKTRPVPGEPANSDVSAAPHRQAIAKTIASTALYLAGDESRMVTDQVMLVDGEVTIT